MAVCGGADYVPEQLWVCAIVPTGDDIADDERCQEIGHNVDDPNNGTWVDQPPCDYPPPPSDCELYGIGCGGDEPDPGDGCTGCGEEPPANSQQEKLDRLTKLLDSLKNKLLPCSDMWKIENYGSMYSNVANSPVPPSVLDRVNSFNTSYQFYSITNLNDAFGSVINCDFFPVKINSLPIVNGQSISAGDFLEYFRLGMNSFIDTTIATFNPYIHTTGADTIDDTQFWQSYRSNAIGSMVSLNMQNDGTIILTDYQNNISNGLESSHYTVSTMLTPKDDYHPVQGNRRWGIYSNQDGTFTFYTMGVDRLSNGLMAMGSAALDFFTGQSGFEQADVLWRSLQTKMMEFINTNGGNAQLYEVPDVIVRTKFNEIRDYLNGSISYEQLKTNLGCQ